MKAYILAEKVMHNWIRYLEDFALSFIDDKPDHSHTNLNWNENENQYETRVNSKGWFMIYSPIKNSFYYRNRDNAEKSIEIALEGKSVGDINLEIEGNFETLELDRTKLFSNLSFKYEEEFDRNGVATTLVTDYVAHQNAIRTLARKSVKKLLDFFNKQSEIRVWPHNFDTGIYCKYDNGLEQYAGYSPADGKGSDFPYFYNGFYKNGEKVLPISYPTLSKGSWEVDRWGGAVRTIEDLNEDDILSFFIESTSVFLNQND